MTEAEELSTEWWACQPAIADLRDIFEDGENLDRDDLRAVWEANVGESWEKEDEKPVAPVRIKLELVLLKDHYWGKGADLVSARKALKGAGCGDTRGAVAYVVEAETKVSEEGNWLLKPNCALFPHLLGKL